MSRLRIHLYGVVIGAVVTFLFGCNDRTTPIDFVVAPGTTDAGSDAASPRTPDPRCEGIPDGSACDVVSGAGICVQRQCVLVACELGYEDCNDDPSDGCEADIHIDASCGECDVSCDGAESCQLGRLGWACSEGSLCPIDRFELDGVREPLCEIQAAWQESWRVQPFELRVDVATDAYDEVVGLGSSGGFATWMKGARFQEFDDIALEPGQVARGVARNEARWALLWPTALVTLPELGAAHVVFRDVCQNTAPFVGLTPTASREFLLASRRDLMVLDDDGCDAGLCVESRFGPAEYLAAFRPDPGAPAALQPYLFGDDEVTACDTCLFGPPGRLAVPSACVAASCQTEIEPECLDCDATGCPTFEIMGVAASAVDDERVYVLTKRGVVGLALPNFEPVFRAERPFDGSLQGAAFSAIDVAVDGDSDLVRILAFDGTLTSLRVGAASPVTTWSPVHAPLKVDGLDPTVVRGFAALPWGAAVADEGGAFVVGLRDLSKSAVLTTEGVPGGANATVVGIDGDGTIVYDVAGRLVPRTLTNLRYSSDVPDGGGR